MMMHMEQSLQGKTLQQQIQQQKNQVRREEQRFSYMNKGTHQRIGRSPHGSILASTRRNETMIGQQTAASKWIGENLMAVRSQHMGVDPRARATRSHLPQSNRNRRCYEVVHMGKNQGKELIWECVQPIRQRSRHEGDPEQKTRARALSVLHYPNSANRSQFPRNEKYLVG